ncbi:hypothetical protein E2C01_039973 [Portunus trituberculatus]|uniref:Uncharacterized protein n=1 Tax=Portunus trituberculatus TaxID=210409 RepID=A0A5B7FM24_PORTR|nr:hypothetical protein [Portunus trituberculatus]
MREQRAAHQSPEKQQTPTLEDTSGLGRQFSRELVGLQNKSTALNLPWCCSSDERHLTL